jgi:hypothetical protein
MKSMSVKTMVVFISRRSEEVVSLQPDVELDGSFLRGADRGFLKEGVISI